MFKVDVPASEVYRISTRPAILKSLATIIEYFNIPKNHKVYFNGEAEVSKLLGGLYNSKRGDDKNTDLGYDDKIFVELDDDYSGYNDELDSESKSTPTTPHMWYDPITNAMIRPVYQNRKYTITINKYFKDRLTAKTFHNKIRSGSLSSHQNNMFDMNTHYPIPWRILECFQSIYKKQLTAGIYTEGPDVNFIKWFRYFATVPTDIISNLIGNNDTLVFNQQVANTGIEFGEVNFAKVSKGAFIGKYEVSWTYSFYWNEHVKWEVQYPIQVYQQPMEQDWIPEVFEQNKMDLPSNRFMESKLAALIFGDKLIDTVGYVALPVQDNWRPPNVNWLSPQLQVLLTVTNDPEQVLLNITSLNGFNWEPNFLKWILKYYNKVTTRHRSPLNFKVYSDNTEVAEEQLTLRENGDLVLLRPPSLSNIYRIVFSLDYALRLYSDDCINDIVTDTEWGRWIIEQLFPSYNIPPYFGENGTLDWWDVHNSIEVGDGDEVEFFERGTMGSVIFAYNAATNRFNYQR